MTNWNTRKSTKWNNNADFIRYLNRHWIKNKDWKLMITLLKEFIAESVLLKDKFTLTWVWTFKKVYVHRWKLRYRYIHFKQSSYLKSLIKIK